MAWNTLYVTGRSGFTAELIEALNFSREEFLTGSYDINGVYLFWVTEKFSIDNLKLILGGHAIFKYRIRFFDDIETYTLSSGKNYSNGLTPEQEQMFRDQVG